MAAAQSPYLQGQAGRAYLGLGTRPGSRQQPGGSMRSPSSSNSGSGPPGGGGRLFQTYGSRPGPAQPTPAQPTQHVQQHGQLQHSPTSQTGTDVAGHGRGPVEHQHQPHLPESSPRSSPQQSSPPPQHPQQPVAVQPRPQPSPVAVQPRQQPSPVPVSPRQQPAQVAVQPRQQPQSTAAQQHQQQQQQQQQQEQSARASLAAQQQLAGPRATTALSGPRSAQRSRQESASGIPPEGRASASPQLATRSSGGSLQRTGTAQGAAASSPQPVSQHPQQQTPRTPTGGAAPCHGLADGTSPRFPLDNTMSFGYDDIPEEDDESGSPVHPSHMAMAATVASPYSGLTLDQYMSRMVTTPASAAATSGLGVSADSGESAPCSPGNASTRTEEDDPGPFVSPRPFAGSAASASAAMAPSPRPGTVGRMDSSMGRRGMLMSSSGRALGVSVSVSGSSGGMAVPATSSMPRLASASRGGPAAGVLPSPGAAGPGTGLRASTALTGGVRTSMTGQGGGPGQGPPMPRGSVGGISPSPQGRGSQSAAAAFGGSAYEDMFPGPMQPDSGLLDSSSDDDAHGPSPLVHSASNHTRRLSSRASALAFSNSLDLRPATAAVVSSPSMARGDAAARRDSIGMSDMDHHSGNHHAIIKQVDLGGLSASLFTPNPNMARDAGSPASTSTLGPNDAMIMSNPSSPDMANVAASRADRRAMAAAAASASGDRTAVLRSAGPSNGEAGGGRPQSLASPKSPMAGIPPPWGVSAREGAFGGGPGADGTGSTGSLQALAARPLSSRGRPSTGSNSNSLPGGDAGAPGTAGSKWAKPHKDGSPAPSTPSGSGPTATIMGSGLVEAPLEARLLAAEHAVARPPTRQVQSARPPGTRHEMELDPSVWQANIAMQLQRPPSRQKPPPEALHLWTPEQQMSMLASGGLGRAGPGGGPGGRMLGRPQSAAPTTYRSSRPTSGPSVKAQGLVGEDMAGGARPPSRQKPPPLSTLLEHDDFPPPPPSASRRPRPGADQLDVVVSGTESEEDSDIDEP